MSFSGASSERDWRNSMTHARGKIHNFNIIFHTFPDVPESCNIHFLKLLTERSKTKKKLALYDHFKRMPIFGLKADVCDSPFRALAYLPSWRKIHVISKTFLLQRYRNRGNRGSHANRKTDGGYKLGESQPDGQTGTLTCFDAIFESFFAVAEDLLQILRFLLKVQTVTHHLFQGVRVMEVQNLGQ